MLSQMNQKKSREFFNSLGLSLNLRLLHSVPIQTGAFGWVPNKIMNVNEKIVHYCIEDRDKKNVANHKKNWGNHETFLV